tara:strand:- start:66 stop:455 length:390 start_codon:yes stop_codon:yes gene_type:complete
MVILKEEKEENLKIETTIKSLLRTILEKSEKEGLKFRFNMQIVEDWGGTPEKREWGYDIDQLIEDLQTWDIPPEQIIIFESGDWLTWELSHFGIECLMDYSVPLEERLDIEGLQKKWEDTYLQLGKGLL